MRLAATYSVKHLFSLSILAVTMEDDRLLMLDSNYISMYPFTCVVQLSYQDNSIDEAAKNPDEVQHIIAVM